MAGWRQVIELAIGEEDLATLRAVARSRTEPASRVERAKMLGGLPGGPVLLCGGTGHGSAPSNGPALR